MKGLLRKLLRIHPFVKTAFYKQWNKILFRIQNVKFGNNMQVYNKIYLQGSGKLIIGDNFKFCSGDSVNPISRNQNGSIYTMRNDAIIKIGNNVGMSSVCLWAKERIEIGNNVNIGANCVIIDNDAHPHSFLMRRKEYVVNEGVDKYHSQISSSPIVIEDDVWIGMQCIVLKGVRIGKCSIIAAGSVVTDSIPSNVIAGGCPCKVIRSIKE